MPYREEYTEESRRFWPGCLIGLGTLALGILLGAFFTTGLLGLDLGYLFGRFTGAAPPLVQATPVPTRSRPSRALRRPAGA